MAHGAVRHGDAAARAHGHSRLGHLRTGEGGACGGRGRAIAQSIDVRVYRGIPYTGTLAAIDREGGEVSFAIAEQPSKGTVTLDGETFVYPARRTRPARRFSPTPRPTPRAAPRPPRRCASPSRAPNAA